MVTRYVADQWFGHISITMAMPESKFESLKERDVEKELRAAIETAVNDVLDERQICRYFQLSIEPDICEGPPS